VLNSKTSKIEELTSFLPKLKNQIPTFERRKAYILE
jgi:hypothetical protein